MAVTDADLANYRKLLQHDLYAFAARCFFELNPQTVFIPAAFLRLLTVKLEACMRGEIRRLIINVPPRQLKSLIASVALPAFWLGHRPSDSLLCVSYAQDLAELFSRQSRQIMGSTFYRDIFPTRLSPTRQAINDFVTTKMGSRVATSVGGVLTGRGADVIIIDDPLKPAEALSEVKRNQVNDWYLHTLLSRLNNKETGCIIIIMQRLHEDDLTGFVLGREPWEVLSFPAIAEQDEHHVINTALGRFTYTRQAKTVLNPARESLATLNTLRTTMDEYVFMSQYQQQPIPREGLVVKQEWFKTYKDGEAPGTFDTIVQSWDTANKVTELSDYSVCTTWGIKGKNLYLLHVLRRRLEFPALERAIIEQQENFKAQKVIIEDKASGTQLIQALRHAGMYHVTPYTPPPSEKLMRLHTQISTIEGGFVHVPEDAPWLADYLREMTAFPGGKHDDQVDSTVQFLAWVKETQLEPGIIGYMRQEVERRRAAGQLPPTT